MSSADPFETGVFFWRTWGSMIAMVFMGYEVLITFDEEVSLMWKRPGFRVRHLFFFLRYFALICVGANHVAITLIHTRHPVSYSACLTWHACQTVAVQLLLTAVHYIMALRVHALYGQSQKVAFLLFCLIVAQTVIMTWAGAETFSHLPFDSSCYVKKTPIEVAIFAVTAMITSCVLLVAMVGRHALALRQNWRGTPITKLVIWDGALAFLVISGVFIGSVIYAMAAQGLSNIVSSWFMAALSVIGCRTILNTQRVNVQNNISPSVELTTGISASLYPELSEAMDTTELRPVSSSRLGIAL